MIFLKSKDFKVGLKVEINNEPFLIVENEFVNPGKGQAFNRLKLKSFSSGLIIRKTIKLGEKLKLAEELMARLERLRPDKLMERKGNEAENLNKALKYRPMVSPYNVI